MASRKKIGNWKKNGVRVNVSTQDLSRRINSYKLVEEGVEKVSYEHPENPHRLLVTNGSVNCSGYALCSSRPLFDENGQLEETVRKCKKECADLETTRNRLCGLFPKCKIIDLSEEDKKQ